MQTHLLHLAMLGLALILGGCGDDQQASARTGSAASAATAAANGAVAESLPLGDQQDFEDVPVLSRAGGWAPANRTFDGTLPALLHSLNEAIAA